MALVAGEEPGLKVLLDSRDLINLGRDIGPTLQQVDTALESARAELVFTLTHLRELAAPLVMPKVTGVAALLNRIEQLPVSFAEETTCLGLELTEAVRAFRAGGEPQGVDPFVDRLDKVTPGEGGTRRFLHYPLSEMASDLQHHHPDLLGTPSRFGEQLAAFAQASRQNPRRRGPLTDYSASLRQAAGCCESLALLTDQEFVHFTSWLQDKASRAAGFSLWWYVREEIACNRGDPFSASDLGDLTLLWILPYTEVASLDRRMRHYVGHAKNRRSDLRVPRLVNDTRGLIHALA